MTYWYVTLHFNITYNEQEMLEVFWKTWVLDHWYISLTAHFFNTLDSWVSFLSVC